MIVLLFNRISHFDEFSKVGGIVILKEIILSIVNPYVLPKVPTPPAVDIPPTPTEAALPPG